MKNNRTQLQWIEMFRNGKSIYHFTELMRLSGLSKSACGKSILRLTKNRIVIKLAKGLYANTFNMPALELVSARLYPPSYISLESALYQHGISEQVPHLITCVSINKTKSFQTGLGEIQYLNIKPDLFLGYELMEKYWIATPEKSVLDYIYLKRQHGLNPALDEFQWENIHLQKLKEMSKKFPKTVQRDIGKLLTKTTPSPAPTPPQSR